MISKGDFSAGLRDLSFEYASRTDVPYIFRPSINTVVRRVVLTMAAFLMMRVADRTNHPFVRLLSRVTLASAFLMCMGQFKRAPLFYFVIWYVLQKHCYVELKKFTRVIVIGVVAATLMVGLTASYQKEGNRDLGKAFLSFGWRLLVGEAIGEFLALEHHGTTFEYRGMEIPARYAQKVAGQDVMTFSEYWKYEVGGGRGYMAVGVMSEIFISVGPAVSFPAFIALAMFLASIDRRMMRWNSNDHRPYIAGIIAIFAFAAVKGALSQAFTGGGLPLILLYVGTLATCREVPSTQSIGPLAQRRPM